MNSIIAQRGLTSNAENDDPKILQHRGLYFDGVDDIAIIDPGSTKVLNIPPNWSTFIWFKYDNSLAYPAYLMGRYDDLNQELFAVYINSSEQVEASVTIENEALTVTATTTSASGLWFNAGVKC